MHFWSQGLKVVAIIVGFKGLCGILCGVLALGMSSHDVKPWAESLLSLIHLHADGAIAHWLMGLADKVNNHRLEVAFVGFSYGSFKLVEAIGLWYSQRWAEWLVVLSTVFCFMPIEFYELWIKVTSFKIILVLINFAIVGFMTMVLKHGSKSKTSTSLPSSL